MKEDVVKAAQLSGMLIDDLRCALEGADAVEGVLLQEIIEQASKLSFRICSLADALKRKERS